MVIETKLLPNYQEFAGGTVAWSLPDGSVDTRHIYLVANVCDGNMTLHVESKFQDEKPPPENTMFTITRKKYARK